MAWAVKRQKLNFKKVFFWNTLLRVSDSETNWLASICQTQPKYWDGGAVLSRPQKDLRIGITKKKHLAICGSIASWAFLWRWNHSWAAPKEECIFICNDRIQQMCICVAPSRLRWKAQKRPLHNKHPPPTLLTGSFLPGNSFLLPPIGTWIKN